MLNRALFGAGPAGRLLPCAAVIALIGGCTTPRPDPQPEHAAAQAVGLTAPLTFRTDGGPIDEPVSGDRLTLAQASELAVTTSPELQAALARVRIAMADADQTRLLPNPVLSLTLRWGPGKPQIEASLAHEFVQVLQRPARASAADNRLRQAAADAVTVALDVASQAQERYIAAQASTVLIPLLKERLTLLDQLASVAKARLDAGEGTHNDLTTLETQRVELQVDIDQASLAARHDRLQLARLIGEPSSAAEWLLDTWEPPGADVAAEARWIETALAHRPEVQSLCWRLRALGDEQALARLLPWEGADAGVDVQRDDKWFTGPSVSTPLPVFDDGQARRDRITAEQIEARHQLTLAKRKVVEEVRTAYRTMGASAANLARVRNELIPLQQQRRGLAESAYRAGQSDVTALFLAEQDLRSAQAKAVEIELQAATARVRLRRAVGGSGASDQIAEGNSRLSAPTPARSPAVAH